MVMKLRQTLSAALVLTALLALANAAKAQAPVEPETEDDEPSRYALEFIVFRYDASVTAGTEVFLPDLPEPDPAAGPADPSTESVDLFGLPGSQSESETGYPEDVSSFARALPPETTLDDDGAAADIPAFGDLQPASELADDTPAMIMPFGDEDLAMTELDAFRARNAIDLRLIPPESLGMTDVHEKLLLLDAYEPVLWSGWTQIVVEEEFSPPISLRRLGNPPAEIDGTLMLYLGRFVHLVTDLTWSVPDQGYASDDPLSSAPAAEVPYFGDTDTEFGYGSRRTEPDTVYINYRITEDRIMRNGDTRYFDHPRFGMIARLALIEPGSPLDPTPRPEVPPTADEEALVDPALLPADDSSVLQPAAPPQ